VIRFEPFGKFYVPPTALSGALHWAVWCLRRTGCIDGALSSFDVEVMGEPRMGIGPSRSLALAP